MHSLLPLNLTTSIGNMNAITIKIKKLSDKAIMPKRATEGSVAYDVYAPEDTIIKRGRQVVPLGFAIELPDKTYEAKIEPRSGLSAKGMEGYLLRTDAETVVDTQLVGGVGVKIIEYVAVKPDCFNADVIVGKIDSDYREGVGVIVNNNDTREFQIKAGMRIAQMTIYRVPETEFVEVEELSETERKGGFGSTGV